MDGYNAYLETLKFINRPMKSLLHPDFGKHSDVYTFTTENIAGYVKKLDVDGRDILTIAASCDHFINLYLCGANYVDCYDLNENTFFYMMLKIVALQVLDYEEFLKFFVRCDKIETVYNGMIPYKKMIGENKHFFDYQIYCEKLRPYLMDNVSIFWDFMYREAYYKGTEICAKGILMGGSLDEAIKNNLYLQSAELYYQARSKCANKSFNFYPLDIYMLHTIEKKYDIILLSNIYDYIVNNGYGMSAKSEFINYVKNTLSNNLNDNGKIAVTYQYHYSFKRNLSNMNALQRLFAKKYIINDDSGLAPYNFQKIVVPSAIRECRDNGENDCLHLYQKGRTKH